MWIAATLLMGACIYVLLRSLVVQHRQSVTKIDYNTVFYHKQMREIETQLADGLISQADYHIAKAEAARSLIKQYPYEKPATDNANILEKQSKIVSLRFVSILILVVVPAISLPIYAWIGSPDSKAAPLEERVRPAAKDVKFEEIIQQIEARLVQKPDDIRGMELIAPLYLRVGRPDDAVRILTELNNRLGASPARDADLGEALVASGGGVVSVAARAAFERALSVTPDFPKARYYIGKAAAQDKDINKARDIWLQLIEKMPEGAIRKMIEADLKTLDSGATSQNIGKVKNDIKGVAP